MSIYTYLNKAYLFIVEKMKVYDYMNTYLVRIIFDKSDQQFTDPFSPDGSEKNYILQLV